MPVTRRQMLFFVLGGFFIMNALLGELTGGKLFAVHWRPFSFLPENLLLSIGVIMWPVVFIFTDIINEYFGKEGVRKLTFLTVGLILFAFGFLYAAIAIPAGEGSPVSQEAFSAVFGQSLFIIVGSLAAFAISQLVDVVVFSFFKQATGGARLWLRATGSTAVSQLVDTYVVAFVAFVVPGTMSWENFFKLSFGNYLYKLLIAIGVTPLIYLLHWVIDRYLAAENIASEHKQ